MLAQNGIPNTVAQQINALNELFVDAVSVPTKQQDAKAVVNLRARIKELTVSHGTLMNKIESDFPDYASLVFPNPATIEEVLHLRAFVLVPLAELAPESVHPVLGVTIGHLAEQVDGLEGVTPLVQS